MSRGAYPQLLGMGDIAEEFRSNVTQYLTNVAMLASIAVDDSAASNFGATVDTLPPAFAEAGQRLHQLIPIIRAAELSKVNATLCDPANARYVKALGSRKNPWQIRMRERTFLSLHTPLSIFKGIGEGRILLKDPVEGLLLSMLR